MNQVSSTHQIISDLIILESDQRFLETAKVDPKKLGHVLRELMVLISGELKDIEIHLRVKRAKAYRNCILGKNEVEATITSESAMQRSCVQNDSRSDSHVHENMIKYAVRYQIKIAGKCQQTERLSKQAMANY